MEEQSGRTMHYTYCNTLDFVLFDKKPAVTETAAHFHPYGQLVLPCGDDVVVRIGEGDAHPLPAGSVRFLSPFVRHHVWLERPGGHWDSLSVNLARLGDDFFSMPYTRPIRQFYQDGFYGVLFEGEAARHCRAEFATLDNVFHMEHLLTALRIMSGLALAPARRRLSVDIAQPPDRREIELCQTIAEHIRNGLGGELDIDSTAAMVHMSPSNFCRFFKRYFGQPFYAYVLGKRFEAACYLLDSSPRSIQDIADRLGFHSASHFAMTFKRRQGLTPGQYRRKQGVARAC